MVLLLNIVLALVVLLFTMGLHQRSQRMLPVYVRLVWWHLRERPDSS